MTTREVYVDGGQRVHLTTDDGTTRVKTLCGRILAFAWPNVGTYTLDCACCKRRAS